MSNCLGFFFLHDYQSLNQSGVWFINSSANQNALCVMVLGQPGDIVYLNRKSLSLRTRREIQAW